jgi:hypothetical protein
LTLLTEEGVHFINDVIKHFTNSSNWTIPFPLHTIHRVMDKYNQPTRWSRHCWQISQWKPKWLEWSFIYGTIFSSYNIQNGTWLHSLLVDVWFASLDVNNQVYFTYI